MTDEKKESSAPVQEKPADAAEVAPPSMFGVPMESFVRGSRSRTSAHDRMIAQEHADAERRRDVAAAERKQAQKPIHQGGAMMYQNRFQDNPEAADSFFSLEYVTTRGEPFYMNGQALGCLADVQVLPDGSVQFVMVCPSCKAEGLPLDRCQMTVNTRNKKFEIDFNGAGEMVLFNDGFGPKAYRSAGIIRETEPFRCSQCGWACRIVKNKVRPE